MPDINITVAHKVAVSDTQSIVCDNSDYMVHWTLDEDWSAYDTKTMRVIYMDGTFEDKVFSGDVIALPVCTVPGAVQIGLFAGDIRTSRVAILRALQSVRSAAGAPDDPTPDVYDQLMERMAQLETSDWAQNDPAAKDYVKNRTHYVSRESKAVVPEQEITTAEQNNFNVAMINDADLDALKTLYDSKDDTTLDVVFDGTSYSCKWLEQDGTRIPIFGNFTIANPSVTDTGEPFCVQFLIQSDAIVALAIACKVAGTHTVAVSSMYPVVHTLDPKYIPVESFSEKLGIPKLQNELDAKASRNNPVFTGAISANRLGNTGVGDCSTTIGTRGKATGKYSFAGGYQSEAVAEGAFAFGKSCQATAPYSFAFGENLVSSGRASHTEGSQSEATAFASHAEGSGCTAMGMLSHAEGSDTTAKGEGSHAEGLFTQAYDDYSHVQGRFNIENIAGYAHVVGNGTYGAAPNNRSNAHTLDWSGNAWFAGDVYTGSTSGKNRDAGSKKLATEEYVDSKISDNDLILTSSTSGSTKKFRITVDDNGMISATEVSPP